MSISLTKLSISQTKVVLYNATLILESKWGLEITPDNDEMCNYDGPLSYTFRDSFDTDLIISNCGFCNPILNNIDDSIDVDTIIIENKHSNKDSLLLVYHSLNQNNIVMEMYFFRVKENLIIYLNNYNMKNRDGYINDIKKLVQTIEL